MHRPRHQRFHDPRHASICDAPPIVVVLLLLSELPNIASPFYVLKEFMHDLVGGDFTAHDGTGGKSIYGANFPDGMSLRLQILPSRAKTAKLVLRI